MRRAVYDHIPETEEMGYPIGHKHSIEEFSAVIARAQRLDKIPPYLFGEIAAAKRKALAEGRDVIDLGIGDPDQPTPAPIIAALNEAARNPETHRYDETNAGWTPFL